MAGSSSTIEKLTNLSNKYIKSVFHYYNEREEWDVEDERLRLLSLEPYMDEIEENKKNLKRYWGSSASAQQEIFTPESIIYVAEIDKLFEDRYTPEVTQLREITLTTDEVRGISDEVRDILSISGATATGGGLKNKRKTKRINTKKKKKRKVKVRTKKKEKKRTVTKSRKARKARKSRKKRNQFYK